MGRPHVLEPIRQVVPPYSLNVAAAVALPSALGDTEHLARYVREVSASRDLLYGNFDRLGIPYWRSDANFVLADFGARCADVVNARRERRIYVRDRSKAPGCAGCVRITAGVLAHTRLAVEAIEEVLCAAQ